MGAGAVGPGVASGTPRRHPDFAKAESGYGGGATPPSAGAGGAGAGAGAGAAVAGGARFPPAWPSAFPRAQPPSPQPPWRPPPPAQPPPAWPHQPYQPQVNPPPHSPLTHHSLTTHALTYRPTAKLCGLDSLPPTIIAPSQKFHGIECRWYQMFM